MEKTKISSKGQVVLPKSIRDLRHWHAGTELSVEPVRDGVLLRPIDAFPPAKFEDVAGCLKYKGRPKTIEEMDKAIAREIKKRRALGRY